MRLIIFLIVAVFLLPYSHKAQENEAGEGEFSMLVIKKGVKIIFNSKGSNFHFDLECNSFNQVESENMIFMADSILIQIMPVPLSIFFGQNVSAVNDSIALIYQMAQEMRNIRETLSGDYIIKEHLGNLNNRVYAFWEFDYPQQGISDDPERVVMQMFATTRAGNKVLMLASAVTAINNPEKVRQKLINAVTSMQTAEFTIDPEEIRKTLVE